jgi:hypothetical protein
MKILLRLQFGCAIGAARHVLLEFVAGVIEQLAVNVKHDILLDPFTLHKLPPVHFSGRASPGRTAQGAVSTDSYSSHIRQRPA